MFDAHAVLRLYSPKDEVLALMSWREMSRGSGKLNLHVAYTCQYRFTEIGQAVQATRARCMRCTLR